MENSFGVAATFLEEVLGTTSADPEVHQKFILDRAVSKMLKSGLSKQEIEERLDEEKQDVNPEEDLNLATTIFPKDEEGNPFLWDYQVKGFFKDAMHALITSDMWTKEELKKARLTQYLYKKTIDQLVFIRPRKIPLVLPEGLEITFCERPLRAETMRGERIALARSEAVPAETSITFEVTTLAKNLTEYLLECLKYGTFRGIGQWRNSGKGRFVAKIT